MFVTFTEMFSMVGKISGMGGKVFESVTGSQKLSEMLFFVTLLALPGTLTS